jgi:hypothetical protein
LTKTLPRGEIETMNLVTEQKAGLVTIAGKEFNLVNPLPEKVIKKLTEAVITFEGGKGDLLMSPFQKLNEILDFIAGGYCGRVYDLGDYILKINQPNHDYNLRDGQIMHALQGVPSIPKLFIYSEDNSYMVVEKIKGDTVANMSYGDYSLIREKWDYETQEKLLEESQKMIEERGWRMGDCHAENCMVDENGKFWVIDVGLFSKLDENEFGRGYDSAQRSLREADQAIDFEGFLEREDKRDKQKRIERKKKRNKLMIKELLDKKRNRKHFARPLLDSREELSAPEVDAFKVLCAPTFKQHQPNIDRLAQQAGIDPKEVQWFANKINYGKVAVAKPAHTTF